MIAMKEDSLRQAIFPRGRKAGKSSAGSHGLRIRREGAGRLRGSALALRTFREESANSEYR
jgi:hypothetical protein